MQLNFDEEITKAERSGDYRLAVRYQFLRKLKLLNDRQAIKFAIDKTNSTYAKEMSAGLRPGFRTIAGHYENVWYGKQLPSVEKYTAIVQDFENIRF